MVLGVLRSGLVEEGNQDRIFTTDVREFYLIRAESPFQNLIIFLVSAMPLLEQNISANTHYCPSTTPKASVLNWDDEELPKEVQGFENLNVIV